MRDEIINGDYIKNLKHLKLESTLRFVGLPKIDSDEKSPSPYRLIFNWLRDNGVRRIIELFVEDVGENPQSDQNIVGCLEGLKVETLNWQRTDMPGWVVHKTVCDSVKELHLYSSGNRAVLTGWSCKHQLPALPEVSRRDDLLATPYFFEIPTHT